MLTIAARGDLNDKDGKYPDDELGFWCGGATDVKVKIMSFDVVLRTILFICVDSKF